MMDRIFDDVGSIDSLPAISLNEAQSDYGLHERYEFKYHIDIDRLGCVLGMLHAQGWCIIEHTTKRNFSYKNVYFDTDNFLCFKYSFGSEKVRWRVRIYDDGTHFLEKKTKSDEQSHKQRHLVSCIPDELFRHGLLMYPRIVTQYKRSSYVHKGMGLRMTIDTDLAMGGYEDNLCGYEKVIIEIKGSRTTLQTYHCDYMGYYAPKTSFSKYEYGVRTFMVG